MLTVQYRFNITTNASPSTNTSTVKVVVVASDHSDVKPCLC